MKEQFHLFEDNAIEKKKEEKKVDPELAAMRKRFAESGESDMQIGHPEFLTQAEIQRKRKKKHGLPGKP